MSTKYQKPYTIPQGFPALLKSFTREILRAQPENIYEFGSKYFSQLLDLKKDGLDAPKEGQEADVASAAKLMNIADLTPTEIEPILLDLFVKADLDNNGYLDRTEFQNILRSAELNFSERQVRQVLAEADENADNVIQYKEFLPVMVDLLQSIKAKEKARAMIDSIESAVRIEVENMLINGVPREELEIMMLKVFKKADKDESGSLTRAEFKDCLKAADLGLTRKDTNLILSYVDADKNGLISYTEFVPVCFQVMVERFKDEILMNDILATQDALAGLLLRSFQALDMDGRGTIPTSAARDVLRQLSRETLGLSTLQILTLMAQAPTNSAGEIEYARFVAMASSMIYSMYDADSVKLRMAAIRQVSEAGGMKQLGSMDIEALHQVLEVAFKEADVDGTGHLNPDQVYAVLQNLNTIVPENIQLSETHWAVLFAAIDTDDSGSVDWTELINFLCDAIEHMEREMFIQERINNRM